MNKRPYFLLVPAFFVCLAAIAGPGSPPGSSQQYGMSVWNASLYIHADDTLMACGDLYLFNADVSGQGSLLLKDTVTSCIVAENSSLPHLIIDNSDTVALQGYLHIRLGLTLARGVLDTRGGNLIFACTSFFHVLPGGIWLNKHDYHAAQWLPPPPSWPLAARQALDTADLPSSCPGVMIAGLLLPQSNEDKTYTLVTPGLVWLQIPYPPPQVVKASFV